MATIHDVGKDITITGLWPWCEIDLDRGEAAGGAAACALAAATAAATVPVAGPIIAAIAAAKGADLYNARGAWGVRARIRVCAAIPSIFDFDTYALPLNGSLLKGSSADVFVIDGVNRRRIPNPDVFNAHGFHWGEIHVVSNADLGVIPQGPDV
ncbi:MAG: hypothetical protein ACXWP4_00120 [Polyangiales bacterium]